MDLNETLVFARVVQAGSFIGASQALGMPRSTVSRKIAELEERLGARLLERTTRTLRLTEAGQAYYQHAARVVAEAEEAEHSVTRLQEVPRGLLRVTAPLNFAFLGPILTAFLLRYPEVQVDLVCTDRVVNLIEEGYDVAIRVGRLADSSLISRPLGVFPSYLVASPDFLARHGAPAGPEALGRYDCIVLGAGTERATWKLHGERGTRTVTVKARFTVNDFDILHEAALAGLGLALLPAYRCVADLRAQRLQRLLPEWCSTEQPMHAVYPGTRHLSPKVQAFLEHVRERMTPPPWELGPRP